MTIPDKTTIEPVETPIGQIAVKTYGRDSTVPGKCTVAIPLSRHYSYELLERAEVDPHIQHVKNWQPKVFGETSRFTPDDDMNINTLDIRVLPEGLQNPANIGQKVLELLRTLPPMPDKRREHGY